MESCYHCGHVCAPASQARGSAVSSVTKSPTLTAKVLKSWLRAEFEVFVLFFKFIMLQNNQHYMGNPFAQALHDGRTLENGNNYQALLFQFIGTIFKEICGVDCFRTFQGWQIYKIVWDFHKFDNCVYRVWSQRYLGLVCGWRCWSEGFSYFLSWSEGVLYA